MLQHGHTLRMYAKLNKPVPETNKAWFYLHEVPKVIKVMEQENGDCQGLGVGENGKLVNGYSVHHAKCKSSRVCCTTICM